MCVLLHLWLWHTQKMADFEEQHALKWGKNVEHPEHWKLPLGSTIQVEHKFLGGSPLPKVVWPVLKVTGAQDDHQWAKDIKIWDEWDKLSLKTEDSLHYLWCYEHVGTSSGLVRAFWKTIYCPGLRREELHQYMLGPSRMAGKKPKTTCVTSLFPRNSRQD